MIESAKYTLILKVEQLKRSDFDTDEIPLCEYK